MRQLVKKMCRLSSFLIMYRMSQLMVHPLLLPLQLRTLTRLTCPRGMMRQLVVHPLLLRPIQLQTF